LGLGGIVGLLGNDLCPFFGVLHELWLSDWVILVALENYKKKKNLLVFIRPNLTSIMIKIELDAQDGVPSVQLCDQ